MSLSTRTRRPLGDPCGMLRLNASSRVWAAGMSRVRAGSNSSGDLRRSKLLSTLSESHLIDALSTSSSTHQLAESEDVLCNLKSLPWEVPFDEVRRAGSDPMRQESYMPGLHAVAALVCALRLTQAPTPLMTANQSVDVGPDHLHYHCRGHGCGCIGAAVCSQ